MKKTQEAAGEEEKIQVEYTLGGFGDPGTA